MTQNRSKKAGFRFLLVAALIGIGSAAAGYLLMLAMQANSLALSSTLILLPESRVIEDFALSDHEGQSFSLENLEGRWSLLFLGFTNCPDVCPNALYDLDLVSKNLGELNNNDSFAYQVVFVSVDSERDTPDKLAQFVGYFNPEFTGVTGTQEELTALARQLGIIYQIEDHEIGATSYDVFHSASIVLTGPRGRLRGAFPPPHDAEMMARDLAAIID